MSLRKRRWRVWANFQQRALDVFGKSLQSRTRACYGPVHLSALVIHTRGDGNLGDTAPAEVTQIAAKIATVPQAVIHIHGGLVTKSSGLAGSLRLDNYYRSAGVLPVFPLWESGLFEAVRNNWKEIFDEKLFQTLLKRLLKHAGGKLLQSAGGRAAGAYEPLDDQESAIALTQALRAEIAEETPEPLRDIAPAQPPSELTADEEKLLKNELATSAELQEAVDAIMLGLELQPPPGARAGAAPVQPAKTHLSPVIQEELRAAAEPGARGLFDPASLIVHAVTILARVINRFARRRDHGLYTTVVEELLRELYFNAIGGKVWGLMKQDTRDAFADGAPGSQRGGSLFLRELAAQLRARSAAKHTRSRISIVAHSAGSIWACHFLQRMSEIRAAGALRADFRLHRLVFLAPACTCRLFAKVLETHAQMALFDEFRVYALSDPLEAGYWEAPPLYPRSLLYLVSGLFEDEPDQPLVGMARYVTETQVYDEAQAAAVRTFLMEPRGRSVWSQEDRGLGLASDARRHGAFDETTGAFIKTMQATLHLLTH
jgi:hypothetical protein